MDKSKYITASERSKKLKRRRFIAISMLFITGMVIIFAISFFISYNRISGNKGDKDLDDIVTTSKPETVEELKKILAEKEDEIEGLKARLEKYEATIDNLQGGGQGQGKVSVTTPKSPTVSEDVYKQR